MRILMTAHPGWGHLHPMIGVARAAGEAGHEVRIATAASLVPALGRLGVTAVAAGLDWEISRPNGRVPDVALTRPLGQVKALARLAGEGMVEDLLRIAAGWTPDVIVRDSYEVGGLIAARRLGIPIAVHGVTVRLPPLIMRRAVGPALARLRERHGLAPDPAADDAVRDLWLSFMPPAFLPPGSDALPQERFVRPALYDRSGEAPPPEWIERLGADGRPIVYVTLGTVFNRREGIFATVLEALAGEDVDVVVTVGRTVDPASLGQIPANVRVAAYIPQTLLLDRVAAVVTHGGFNTVMAALSFGVPVCSIPLSADHPINARRCVELGAGTAVTTWTPRTGLPVARAQDLTPAAVRAAVRPLLEDPSFRAEAGRLRAAIEALPGPAEVVRLIEDLGRRF